MFRQKRIRLFTFGVLFSFIGIPAWAGSTTIWKQANNPANYVALEDIKESLAEDLILNHPYNFDPKKLADMLLSLRYNKRFLLRRGLTDRRLFFDDDLLEKKFIPKIVEAFQQATPYQVVAVSIVQKDPYFIVRNDRLNMFRAYVAQDGLHLLFLKSDAKLFGDYQAHGPRGERMRETAVEKGVTLEPQDGQKLSFADPREIILDLNYDFAALVDRKAEEEESREKEDKKRKKRSESAPVTSSTSTGTATSSSSSGSVSTGAKTPADRLKELKQLKEQGLITNQEYEAKRKEILKDL